MKLLTIEQRATLKEWFLPERPGPLVGLHVLQTGHGACWADRWPNPRALLVETAGNYSLAGDPTALQPDDLKTRIAGFVEAPEPFVPLLQESFDQINVWDRIIFELPGRPKFSRPPNYLVRRLNSDDSYHLWGLSPHSSWISKTWGGPAGLAASNTAWGAFNGEQLVSVACVFFVGEQYEELGVVTEPKYRGLGLGVACAGAVCKDVLGRGRRPGWTTSPDNTGSIRVAEKLGFTLQRRDCLYAIGVDIP